MRTGMADSQELILPGVYTMTWLTYAAENGLSVSELVRHAGLAEEEAASFSAGVPLSKFRRLTETMLARLGDHGIGFEIGWRQPPTAFGSLGSAMLASATARDALELCQRYWHLLSRGMGIDVSIHQDICVITLALQFPVAEPFRHIMFESSLASVYRGVVGLVPQAASVIEVWFASPEPVYGARIRERMPGVRFDMPVMQVRAPSALLDLPLAMASATGLRTALEQCDAEEKTLKLHGKIILKVQNKLQFNGTGYPTLEIMADLLSMSPRTLRRRLAEEGTGYSQLLETARRRDAIRLLDNPEMRVTDVAGLLGYTDSANFVRAFRKWTGTTPLQYRAMKLGS